MGCVCCSFSSFISIVLDALERISMCTVCALLTCCIVLTIIIVIIMGIGIGYHYCFVQHSITSMGGSSKSGPGRSGPEGQGSVMRSIDRAVRRGFSHRVERRDIDNPPITNNNTDLSNTHSQPNSIALNITKLLN